jgi:Cna protein B-type domain
MNERELRSAGAEKYKSYAAVNYLYQTEMSQNMSVYGHSNPIGMEMGFRIKPIGELEIMKEAEGGFIEGISFVIKSKDGSYEKTVMTDEEGKFNLQNIPAGKYTVTETVPDGFVANQPQTVIIEAGKKNVIKFENRFQRGIINLEKRGDIFTGNASDEEEYEPVATEKGLEGAVYEVIACEDFTAYDGTFLQKSGDVADILTTDQTGKARSKELYLGRYTLREIKAPEGYQTDNTVYDVELTYDRDSLTVETSVKVRDDMKYGKMMMAYDFSPSVLEMSRDRIFPSVPKTGDERYLLLSVSGGLAAFAAIGVILMRRRYIK